jgi:hypothetical protein
MPSFSSSLNKLTMLSISNNLCSNPESGFFNRFHPRKYPIVCPTYCLQTSRSFILRVHSYRNYRFLIIFMKKSTLQFFLKNSKFRTASCEFHILPLLKYPYERNLLQPNATTRASSLVYVMWIKMDFPFICFLIQVRKLY